MTGPEHFRVAESLTDTARQWWDDEETRAGAEFDIACAQVHATLALADASRWREPMPETAS